MAACKPMWHNMRAYQTIANNPCPYINVELLRTSRLAYTMRILLCPLVLVVNIDDASSVKSTDDTNAQHFVEQNTNKSCLAVENQQA
jgi:hypothetical protein